MNEEDPPQIFPDVQTRLHWAMEDPRGAAGDQKIKAFWKVRDQIHAKVRDSLAEIPDTSMHQHVAMR